MKKILYIITSLCVLINFSASAQSAIPTLKAPKEKDGTVLLQDLSIKVDVVGNIATTTFDMVFYNSSSRTMEGEFEFPLGDGQTVSRYALEINGKLREGVVVEKQKGRQTFEEITRRKVDPGLLEKTVGNNFRTRIYPFNPKGTRRVVIACEQELKTVDGKRTFRLPMASDITLKTFKVDVSLQNQAMPLIPKGNMNLSFDKKNGNYSASFFKKDYQPKKSLVIELPLKEVPSVNIENAGADTYFYTFAKIPYKQRSKVLPKTLTVIYDVSSSSENSKHDKNRELLRWYIEKANVQSVRLVTFSVDVHSDAVYSPNEALSVLESLKFDGGTQLGCLNLDKYDSDEIILFSDGISNIGASEINPAKKPLIVVNSNNATEHSALKMLAAKSHGIYIDLSSVSEQEAQKLISETPYSYLGAKYDSDKISDVYPSLPCSVGETFSVSGIMKPKTAKMVLYFGFGKEVTDSLVYEVSAVEGNASSNIKRIWVQKKLAELDLDYNKNENEITALAKKHGVVTRNTSLIVLDGVEDYVRYGIVPPEELREEYNSLMNNRGNAREPEPDTNTIADFIIRDRKDFLAWWNTNFKVVPKTKKANNQLPGIAISGGAAGSTHNAPPPPPPPATPAPILLEADDVEEEVAYFAVEDIAYDVVEVGYGRSSGSQSRSSGSQSRNEEQTSAIKVQYWNPDVPYLSELKSTPTDKMYDKYLLIKKDYISSPTFYMDVAQYFYRENMVDDAIRIVSNLCEMKLEDAEISRSCANLLTEFKKHKLAASVLEKVVKMRGEEPQSYRDLAMAYSEMGEYQKAADLFYKVGSNEWDSRFRKIQQIAINDLNALIALNPTKIDTSNYDQRLMGNCPVDVRILLSWNTNDSDIDLHVTDPNGETCFYRNDRTEIGGRLSEDIIRGYGPEEFCLKKALEGDYTIEVNYYGSSVQKKLQPVVVTAIVYTKFGTPNQKKQVLTLQLSNVKDVYKVGTINFKNK